MQDASQPTPEDNGEPESDDQQNISDSAQDWLSLRDLIGAAEAGQDVTMPPEAAHAMVQMQKDMARVLTPMLELQKHLAASSTFTALQQMADTLKAAPPLLSDWPGAAKAAADLAAAYKPVIELNDALRRHFASSHMQQAMEALRQAQTAFTPPNRWCPRNWSAHSWSTSDIKTAMAILCDEGIPLAWVPRDTIVAELIHAPDPAARQAILAARIPEIVEDCRDVLSVILDPELKPLVGLADSALDALGVAPPAAQALAANIFETFLRDANRRGQMFGGNFGYFKTDKVIKRITAVSDDTPTNEFREACVLTPALLALQSYNPETDPLPTEFGRHSTVHRAHPQHYTPTNAVVAVMLAVSFLRQAQQSGW